MSHVKEEDSDEIFLIVFLFLLIQNNLTNCYIRGKFIVMECGDRCVVL